VSFDFQTMEAHRGKDLAVTGHRPDKLGGFDNPRPHNLLRAHMMASMMAMEPACLISGMALGVDTWAAECAIAMGVPLIAAIPFKEQSKRWPKWARDRYDCLLCEGAYYPAMMQARNEWMVDRCDLLLAYWDGSEGGTGNCVRYARRVGRHIARPDLAELLRGL
jgi:uncharacterized phage-like protein YoqJ